jgi:phosphatidylserine decarboxylase
MMITRYGLGIVVGSWVVFAVFLALAIWTRLPAVIAFAVLVGIFSLFNMYFFRDPERTIPENPDAIVSPADGKVVQIVREREENFFQKEVTRVSIFLSVFNVHVNRIPISGRVTYLRYIPGKFFAAFKEKASLENEQTAIGIEDEQGRRVLFKQIAGIIARRIICEVREGDTVRKGERMGMIRYGSRVDVFFESDSVELNVSVGDKVKGGETIIGVFR